MLTSTAPDNHPDEDGRLFVGGSLEDHGHVNVGLWTSKGDGNAICTGHLLIEKGNGLKVTRTSPSCSSFKAERGMLLLQAVKWKGTLQSCNTSIIDVIWMQNFSCPQAGGERLLQKIQKSL